MSVTEEGTSEGVVMTLAAQGDWRSLSMLSAVTVWCLSDQEAAHLIKCCHPEP